MQCVQGVFASEEQPPSRPFSFPLQARLLCAALIQTFRAESAGDLALARGVLLSLEGGWQGELGWAPSGSALMLAAGSLVAAALSREPSLGEEGPLGGWLEERPTPAAAAMRARGGWARASVTVAQLQRGERERRAATLLRRLTSLLG